MTERAGIPVPAMLSGMANGAGKTPALMGLPFPEATAALPTAQRGGPHGRCACKNRRFADGKEHLEPLETGPVRQS